MLNTFNLSLLQTPKTFVDFYYYFIGSISFGLCLVVGERVLNHKLKRVEIFSVFNANFVATAILIVYILLFLYSFSKTGIRFLANDLSSLSSYKYVIPGISGLLSILLVVLLMYIPCVCIPLKVIISISVLFFSGLCNMKRGDIMRILLFLLLYVILLVGKRLFTMKYLTFTGICLIFLVIGFTVIGDYRQNSRSGGAAGMPTITDISEGKLDSDVFNWIYTYTSINFDVLKLHYDVPVSNYPDMAVIPIRRVFGDSDWILEYTSKAGTGSLRGFNASTFISFSIHDFGVLYFVELFVMGILISFVSRFALELRFTGIYVFMLMLILISVMGNYFVVQSYFFAFCVAFILMWFTKPTSLIKGSGVTK